MKLDEIREQPKQKRDLAEESETRCGFWTPIRGNSPPNEHLEAETDLCLIITVDPCGFLVGEWRWSAIK